MSTIRVRVIPAADFVEITTPDLKEIILTVEQARSLAKVLIAKVGLGE